MSLYAIDVGGLWRRFRELEQENAGLREDLATARRDLADAQRALLEANRRNEELFHHRQRLLDEKAQIFGAELAIAEHLTAHQDQLEVPLQPGAGGDASC